MLVIKWLKGSIYELPSLERSSKIISTITWHQHATALTYNIYLDLRGMCVCRNKVFPLAHPSWHSQSPGCCLLFHIWPSFKPLQPYQWCHVAGQVAFRWVRWCIPKSRPSWLSALWIVPFRSAAVRGTSQEEARTLGSCSPSQRPCHGSLRVIVQWCLWERRINTLQREGKQPALGTRWYFYAASDVSPL